MFLFRNADKLNQLETRSQKGKTNSEVSEEINRNNI